MNSGECSSISHGIALSHDALSDDSLITETYVMQAGSKKAKYFVT